MSTRCVFVTSAQIRQLLLPPRFSVMLAACHLLGLGLATAAQAAFTIVRCQPFLSASLQNASLRLPSPWALLSSPLWRHHVVRGFWMRLAAEGLRWRVLRWFGASWSWPKDAASVLSVADERQPERPAVAGPPSSCRVIVAATATGVVGVLAALPIISTLRALHSTLMLDAAGGFTTVREVVRAFGFAAAMRWKEANDAKLNEWTRHIRKPSRREFVLQGLSIALRPTVMLEASVIVVSHPLVRMAFSRAAGWVTSDLRKAKFAGTMLQWGLLYIFFYSFAWHAERRLDLTNHGLTSYVRFQSQMSHGRYYAALAVRGEDACRHAYAAAQASFTVWASVGGMG